jgi:phage major head subunit gpT-like protein
MGFEEWLRARGFNPAMITAEQRTSLHAMYGAEQPSDVHASIADERRRRAAQIRREALTSSTSSDPQVIEAALCRSLNIPDAIASRGLSQQAMETASNSRFRAFGIQRLLIEAAQSNNADVSVGRIDNDSIRAAFSSDPMLGPGGVVRADGGFSTLSFTGILSNLANKAMLTAYSAVQDVTPLFCSETDTNDFKQFSRYRLTGSGVFEEVGPTGELANAEMSEETYNNQVKTFGRTISLTRQMIINDDLSAFADIPRILGRMAALAKQQKVYTILLANGGSFFASGNKNYASGAGSVLSIAGLTAAVKLFREQKDSAGQPILATPRRTLVPAALEATAKQLFRDTTVVATGVGSSAAVIPNSNPHQGLYEPVVAPYLGTSFALSGASDTGWYLLADPADIAIMQLAYLKGQRTPIIETAQADFSTLGVKYRGYWDFGVALQDKRGGVLSAGA